MSISVDFLAPKPIEDGADLSNQWSRFKDEFELFLTAAEKTNSDDKVKVALLLRCVGPRGSDIFKTFTFQTGKSKYVYKDVIEKFDAFCNRGTNKLVKRHQLLSMKQNTLTIDEYVTALHKVARECQLNTMYDDFMLQALLLSINDDQLRRKLFDDAGSDTGLGLEQAIKKCRIAENSKNDMATLQSEEAIQVVTTKKNDGKNDNQEGTRLTWVGKSSNRSVCRNCGGSHPP